MSNKEKTHPNNKKNDLNVIASLVYPDRANIPKRSDSDSKASMSKHTQFQHTLYCSLSWI